MDITAVYELPVPLWSTCDALDAGYATGLGVLRFRIVLPTDRPPIGAPPTGWDLDLPPDPSGRRPVWTQEYGAFIPDSLRPATTLHRVVVTDVDGPTDADRSWRTPDQQLGEAINTSSGTVRWPHSKRPPQPAA